MIEPIVVYEKPEFIVVNKPAGLIVHRPKLRKGNSDEVSLTDWLIKHYPEVKKVGDDPEERPGIVHRLDKETSGLLIIPKTQNAFESFKSQFQAHTIRKTYLALVYGVPPEKKGVIEKPIGIIDGSVKRSVFAKKFLKDAVTKYKVRKTGERDKEEISLLEVTPETGRTHQIRVHLKSISCPIVGDPLYGRKKEAKWATRMCLHAWALEFSTPEGEGLRLESDIPKEFEI